MILIKDKSQCCGCQACEQRCPKHCISMKRDAEGFLYPEVDVSNCVNCGLCERVCPVKNPFEPKPTQNVFAAINKDEKIRLESSSGGIFTLLAEKVISEGGVVFGARYDENWQVLIDYTETIGNVVKFRGSKYVQSRTANSISQCEQFLKQGRKVLYSGTPCQIAGLKHYLQKEYENLLTCDVVCHGSPSPEVWKRYLEEMFPKGLSSIKNILFREKHAGWKNYSLAFYYEQDGKTGITYSLHKTDLYMSAFLTNLILRPSCYSCKAKEGVSRSDFTLADYWGVAKYHPEMDDDKGTSLVVVNSEKGKSFLESLQMEVVTTNIENAIPMNPGLKSEAYVNINRTRFFDGLNSAKSVKKWIWYYTKPSLFFKLKHSFGWPRRFVKRLLKKKRGT